MSVVDRASAFLCKYLEENGTEDPALDKLAKGASDELLEKVLEYAEKNSSVKAACAIAGILSQRHCSGEDRNLQKEILQEMRLMRQQMDFIGSIMMLAMQNMGYGFVPDKEEQVPQPAPPGGSNTPVLPSGYKLHRDG